MMRFPRLSRPGHRSPAVHRAHRHSGLTADQTYDFVFTWAQPLAVVWLLIMTGINYLGVRLGGAVQVFLTTIKSPPWQS